MKSCTYCGAVMPDGAESCPVCGGIRTAPLLPRREPEKAGTNGKRKRRVKFDLRLYTVLIAVLLALIFAAIPFLPRDDAPAEPGQNTRWISLDEGRYPMP